MIEIVGEILTRFFRGSTQVTTAADCLRRCHATGPRMELLLIPSDAQIADSPSVLQL